MPPIHKLSPSSKSKFLPFYHSNVTKMKHIIFTYLKHETITKIF